MPKYGQGFMQEARVVIELSCHHQVMFKVSHAPKTRGHDSKRRVNNDLPGEEIWCTRCVTMREAMGRVSGLHAKEWRYVCTCGYRRRYAQDKQKCVTAATRHHLTKHPAHSVSVLFADKEVYTWWPEPQLELDENKPSF